MAFKIKVLINNANAIVLRIKIIFVCIKNQSWSYNLNLFKTIFSYHFVSINSDSQFNNGAN